MIRRIPLLLLLLLAPLAARAQEEPTQAEIQLRDNLRTTMVQLRDAQGQIAALQGTQLQNEKQIKKLETELKSLKKKSEDDSQAAVAQIGDLEKQVAEQDARNAAQIEALGKWKKAYEQVADLARATEAKRAQLANEKILLQRKVDERTRTNLKLYETAKEVLDRYESFGLHDAVLVHEPFVGNTRVKFQNLMQDYGDQLSENKIKE